MNTVKERLRAEGIEARLIPLDVLKKAKEEYARIDRSGVLWNDYYKWLVFGVPEEFKGARSILVAAMPSNAVSVTFCDHGENKALTIPPTYLLREREQMQQSLESCFTDGERAQRAGLPHKLLAVLGGLAVYGRNNIAYVNGHGSFVVLQTYLTTLEPEDDIRDVEFAEECETCFACAAACPTGAVKKRSLHIDAERCLTRYNEHDEAMPEWIPERAHNSIVGCMRCQLACPMNEGKLKTEQGPVFSEEETRAMLSGAAYETLPETTKAKLKDIDYDGSYAGFVRNISVLLEN